MKLKKMEMERRKDIFYQRKKTVGGEEQEMYVSHTRCIFTKK